MSDKWTQGRLIEPEPPRGLTKRQREIVEARERRMVYREEAAVGRTPVAEFNSEEDARLGAAAPELLNILKRIAADVEDADPAATAAELLRAARELISRIED